jgi:ATP-dependent 26S proteasome regulatory subunit
MPFPGQPIDPSKSLSKQLDRGQTRRPIADGQPAPEVQAVTTVEQFRSRPARCQLTDLILPAVTRRQFDVLLSRLRHHDLLYNEWELSRIDPVGCCKAVNFYGPPGTGKTMCAEALASELNVDLIEVNYAEIESKYVGETPKNICAAFRQAQESHQEGRRPALLFFDEADSILGRRMTNVTQAADHSVNVSRAVMLKQLDEFNGVVVFATNLAKNFDGAFVRRILFHVEVPPPDCAGRKQLWQRMIGGKVPGRQLLDWDVLAQQSDGLAGGEIKNAVIIALSGTAARQAPERQVRMPDLLEAIADMKRAKTDIGRYDYDAP